MRVNLGRKELKSLACLLAEKTLDHNPCTAFVSSTTYSVPCGHSRCCPISPSDLPIRSASLIYKSKAEWTPLLVIRTPYG